jgi:hypothetical protein
MPTKKNQKRNDAGEGAFFLRELELLKARVFQRLYPELTYDKVVPVSPDKDPAALQVTYRMYDGLGVAKIISNYADDIPRADVEGREFTAQVHTLAIAVGWNIWEQAAGRKVGRPIEATKLMTARQILERLANRLTFFGNSALNIPGLTTITNMPNTVVPTFDGDAITWAAKIAKGEAGKNAVMADLNLPFSRMSTATNGIESPDTLLVSPTSLTQLATTPRANQGDTTLLEFFTKAHPGVTVIAVPELETSGTGGGRQMIAYRRSPEKLELEIPEDIVIHEPEKRGLEYVVAMTMRYAGVQVKYPLSLDSSYGM